MKGTGAGAGAYHEGDVVGVMLSCSGNRLAFYRNGVLHRSVSCNFTDGPASLVPFVSIGAADLSAVLVTEPIRLPPAPSDWNLQAGASPSPKTRQVHRRLGPSGRQADAQAILASSGRAGR